MDESPVSVSTSRLRPSESPTRDSSIMNTNNNDRKDNNNNDSNVESTAEERLRALQARTEQWKVTVAAQLKDAARKNKLLREELSAARTQREADLAALRLELHNEFKERTRLQTESITALSERIAELQEEQAALQEAHSAAALALEQRVRSECAAEAAKQVSVAVAAERQRMAEVTAEREAMERRAGEALQAERQRCAERDAMTERYKELVSLFTSAEEDKDLTSSVNDMSDVAHKESDTSSSDEGITGVVHAHHLAALRARLTGQSAKLHEQLTAATQEWQSERQRLMHEVHARDEQLVVVQTLLQQAQTERRSYEQRMQDAQLYRQEVEQSVRARVTNLERQLSALQGQLHDAEQNSATLQRRLQEEQERVRGLVEEAQAREEAITALVQSEGNKAVVYNLERALRATREELEQYKLRCTASEAHTSNEGLTKSTTQETSTRSHSSPLTSSTSINNTHGSVNEKTTTGSSAAAPSALIVEGVVEGDNNASGTTPLHVLHDERAAELTAREARLASREAQLASKEALLHSVEAKLEETKRSLAAHVSTLQRSGQLSSPPRTHGTSGANASDDDDDTTRIVVNDAEDEVVGRPRPSPLSAASHRTRGKTLYTLLKHVGSQVLRRRPWRWPMRSAGFSSYAAGTATTSSTTPSANAFGRHELRSRLSGSLRSIVATRSRLLLAAMAALIVFIFFMNAWQAQAYNQTVQSTPTVVQPVQA